MGARVPRSAVILKLPPGLLVLALCTLLQNPNQKQSLAPSIYQIPGIIVYVFL